MSVELNEINFDISPTNLWFNVNSFINFFKSPRSQKLFILKISHAKSCRGMPVITSSYRLPADMNCASCLRRF